MKQYLNATLSKYLLKIEQLNNMSARQPILTPEFQTIVNTMTVGLAEPKNY